MTDWIDFLVYTMFLAGLWFVNPTNQRRLAIPMLRDRNPEWMAAHPDFVRKLQRGRWNLWLSYALGAASIAVLASLQLGLWTPEPMPDGTPVPRWAVLWQLAMASMILAMVAGGSAGLIAHFRLRKLIPVAARRQATLERRSLDDYVPRWVRYGVYALVIANLAAWVAAGIAGTHSSPVFWSRVVIMFVLSAVFYLATKATVGRRPGVLDRVIGPPYRRREVRYVFAMQVTPPLIGALRLYEEVNATLLFDMSRAAQLLLALFIAYGLLWLVRLPSGRDSLDAADRTAGTAGLSHA
jgi:hypothetical protein